MGIATVTQTDLLEEIETHLPDGLTKSDAKKVLAALAEAVPAILADGYAVSIVGLVKLDPIGVPARTVRSLKEFGNSDSGYVTKKKPSDTKIKALALKKAKDGKPTKGSKAGKELISIAQEKYDEAVARREAREAEAEKQRAKDEREAKKQEKAGTPSRGKTPARSSSRSSSSRKPTGRGGRR